MPLYSWISFCCVLIFFREFHTLSSTWSNRLIIVFSCCSVTLDSFSISILVFLSSHFNINVLFYYSKLQVFFLLRYNHLIISSIKTKQSSQKGLIIFFSDEMKERCWKLKTQKFMLIFPRLSLDIPWLNMTCQHTGEKQR